MEEFLHSVDTIVSQRLNEVRFDKTEICEVISQKDNIYWVSNGTVKYEASPMDKNKTYSKGSKVYVLVPQGDYSLNKSIIGAYTSDEKTESNYTNPFDSLVIGDTFSLKNPLIATIEKEEKTFPADNITGLFNYNKDYDYIGMEFRFITSLEYKQGEYDVLISYLDKNNKELGRDAFSSKEIFGDPYNLSEDFSFYKMVKLKDRGFSAAQIANIVVQLGLDNKTFNNKDEGKTITLSHFSISFGYDKNTAPQNTIVLALDKEQSLTWNIVDYPTDTFRNLYFDWFSTDEKGVTTVYNLNNEMPEGAEIYWLQYKDGSGLENSSLPKDYFWNWKRLENKKNTVAIELNTTYTTDQYKVVIKKPDGVYVQSNAIVFRNDKQGQIPGITTGDQLKFTITDSRGKETNGVYNVYGLDGYMVSMIGEQTISFSFFDGLDPKEYVKEVYWNFPFSNSMISSPRGTVTGTSCPFTISPNLLSSAANNTITCKVLLTTGEVRKGSINLLFGQMTTDGTDYSLNLNFKGTKSYLMSGETATIQARFLKQDGTPVDNVKLKWDWVLPTSLVSFSSTKELESTSTNIEGLSELKICCSSLGNNPVENYSILRCYAEDYPLPNGTKKSITTYLPIPLTSGNILGISGPTRIVYAMDQKTCSYERSPYKVEVMGGSSNEKWELITPEGLIQDGIPSLMDKTLFPANLFLGKEIPQVCIRVTAKVNSGPASQTTVWWSQPVLILSNSWNSKAINNWDGKVKVDDVANYIASPFYIAGTKDDENRLTGLVIGDLRKASVTNEVTTGIYGFDSGQMRYAFKDDGSFFVGTENSYIDFNEATSEGKKNELIVNSIFRRKYKPYEYFKENSYYKNVNKQTQPEAFLGQALPFEFNGVNGEVCGLVFKNSETWKDPETEQKVAEHTETLSIGHFFPSANPQDSGFLIQGESCNELWIRAANARQPISGVEPEISPSSCLNLEAAYAKGNRTTNGYAQIDLTGERTAGEITFSTSGTGQPSSGTLGDGYVFLRTDYKPNTAGFYGSQFHVLADQISFNGTVIHSASVGTASDSRLKYNIENIPENYSIFFDKIVPRRYKYKDGFSKRYHTGFIAQEIEQCLKDASIETKDFAGIMKVSEKEDIFWTLRYEEFIALNTLEIQKLKKRVQELETEIKEIKQ